MWPMRPGEEESFQLQKAKSQGFKPSNRWHSQALLGRGENI
jgi:hypothetical protein